MATFDYAHQSPGWWFNFYLTFAMTANESEAEYMTKLFMELMEFEYYYLVPKGMTMNGKNDKIKKRMEML